MNKPSETVNYTIQTVQSKVKRATVWMKYLAIARQEHTNRSIHINFLSTGASVGIFMTASLKRLLYITATLV